jgi:small subunit ribosomal protein S20
MANHANTKKSVRKTIHKTEINKNRKSRIKTYIKRVNKAIQSGVLADANQALIEAQSEIMMGVNTNIIKPNTASRKISSLARKVNAL